MYKLGMNLFLWTDSVRLKNDKELIDRVLGMGFDGLEIPVMDMFCIRQPCFKCFCNAKLFYVHVHCIKQQPNVWQVYTFHISNAVFHGIEYVLLKSVKRLYANFDTFVKRILTGFPSALNRPLPLLLCRTHSGEIPELLIERS